MLENNKKNTVVTYRSAKIILHPNLRCITGHEHAYGIYFGDNHSPEYIAENLKEAVSIINGHLS